MRLSPWMAGLAALTAAASGLGACTVTPPPRPPPKEVKAADKPGVLEHLGDDVARTGDAGGAIDLYRGAAKAAPDDPAPLVRLGDALNNANDPQRAEQAYRGALALQPGTEGARQGLAVALLAENRPAEALPLLNGFDEDSAGPRLFRAKGTALDLLGRGAEAQSVYRRGLVRAPTDAALHGDLALSLALSGDAANAMAEMRAAVGAPQPDPRQDGNAVLVLGLLHRTDEARARGSQTIGADATATLLARVDLALHTQGTAGRAAALGVLTSNSMKAPPAAPGLLPPPETAGVNAGPVSAVPAPAPAAGSVPDPIRRPNPPVGSDPPVSPPAHPDPAAP